MSRAPHIRTNEWTNERKHPFARAAITAVRSSHDGSPVILNYYILSMMTTTKRSRTAGKKGEEKKYGLQRTQQTICCTALKRKREKCVFEVSTLFCCCVSSFYWTTLPIFSAKSICFGCTKRTDRWAEQLCKYTMCARRINKEQNPALTFLVI